jgi:hypothetical protein
MAGVTECMRGSRKHLVKPANSIVSNGRDQELKTAKQILAEVFHTQLCDVEDMIMRRLVEKDPIDEKENHANWGAWPEMFLAENDIKS